MFAAPTTSAAESTRGVELADVGVAARLLDDARLQPLERLLDLGQVVSQDEIGGLQRRTGFLAHRVGVLSVVMDYLLFLQPTGYPTRRVGANHRPHRLLEHSETVPGSGWPKELPSPTEMTRHPDAQPLKQRD